MYIMPISGFLNSDIILKTFPMCLSKIKCIQYYQLYFLYCFIIRLACQKETSVANKEEDIRNFIYQVSLIVIGYGKCSKILNTFLFLFSNKIGVIRGNSQKACQNSKQGRP